MANRLVSDEFLNSIVELLIALDSYPELTQLKEFKDPISQINDFLNKKVSAIDKRQNFIRNRNNFKNNL